jgi:hypothetical protein
MARHTRPGTLVAISLLAILAAFAGKPLPQDPAYHDFADQRSWLAVNNAANVLSNLPFLLTGIAGLLALRAGRIAPDSRYCLAVFFAGITGTAFGSAWYHFQPDNDSLFWDRLPMTLAFMGLFACTLAEYVSGSLGRRLLVPLLLAGLLSVVYWAWSAANGGGDLRWYFLVQFLPILLIPLILWLYRGESDWTATLIGMLVLYALAKLCEELDSVIYAAGELVSGHTLKHLLAAVAAWLPVQHVRKTGPYAGP